MSPKMGTDQLERLFAESRRDYASLWVNFEEMHGRPMPGDLVDDVLALRARARFADEVAR